MKTTILFALILIGLGSCTETIEIEKLVRDTVWLQRPSLAPSFITLYDTIETVRTDTVEIQTVITKTDTLLLVVTRDSIVYQIQEKEVTTYDTIIIVERDTIFQTLYDTITLTEYETRIVYLNTEYIYIFPGQDAFYIPEPFMPHYLSFIAEANARNKQLPGGSVVLTQVDPSELTGEGWVSESWEIAGFQWIIRLSNELTVEESKAAIFREMGRWQLKKQYSKDVNKIMSNFFRTSPEPTTSEINTLFL